MLGAKSKGSVTQHGIHLILNPMHSKGPRLIGMDPVNSPERRLIIFLHVFLLELCLGPDVVDTVKVMCAIKEKRYCMESCHRQKIIETSQRNRMA